MAVCFCFAKQGGRSFSPVGAWRPTRYNRAIDS
jgi:hypothetical protein